MGKLFAASVLLLAILYGLVLAFRELRRRRRLRALVRDTATRPASQLVPGLVAVEGRAVAVGAPLSSPLQDLVCLAYRVEVERLQQQSRRDREWTGWKTLHHDQRRAPLAIEDETGAVPLELGSAPLGFGSATRGELRPAAGVPPDGTPAARALALAKGDRGLGVRWEEACLRQGEPLFAFGTWSGSSLVSTPSVPIVVSAEGRQGAVRDLGAAARRKVLECAFLLCGLLFVGAALAAGIGELGGR